MFGKNPKRAPLIRHDGKMLDVVEIFPTIQGEGPFAGRPSIFIRLGGCNLACDFCDTEFEDFQGMALEEIFNTIKKTSTPPAGGIEGGLYPDDVMWKQPPPGPPRRRGEKSHDLIVITGGEPLRQNIAPLCEALLAEGYHVQIETNGTLYQPLPDEVHIVCSPKYAGNAYTKPHTQLWPRINALKFIVSASHKNYQNIAPWCGAQKNMPEIFVQPMDEYDAAKNAANVKHAEALCMQYGYRLSLQLHKILGIA